MVTFISAWLCLQHWQRPLKKGLWHELRAVIAQAISMNSTFKLTQRKSCSYTVLYHDHIHPPSCSRYNITPKLSGALWSIATQPLTEMRKKSRETLWIRVREHSHRQSSELLRQQSQLMAAWHRPESKAGLLKATHPTLPVSTQGDGLTDTKWHFSV